MSSHARRSSTKLIKQFVFSSPFLVLLASFSVQLMTQFDQSLFGQESGHPLIEAFAFSPADPWRNYGLSLLIYPLAHLGWSHWAMSALLWIYLGPELSAYFDVKNSAKSGTFRALTSLIFYLMINLAVALSFQLPFAPMIQLNDRILGLSALILAHLGLLIVVWPKPSMILLLIGLVASFWMGDSVSPVSTWAHIIGFTCGTAMGLSLRLGAKKTFG